MKKAVRTRDVIFDESLFYYPAELDIGYLVREEKSRIIEILDLPDIEEPEDSTVINESLDSDVLSDETFLHDQPVVKEREERTSVSTYINTTDSTTSSKDSPVIQLPTPETTPDPLNASDAPPETSSNSGIDLADAPRPTANLTSEIYSPKTQSGGEHPDARHMLECWQASPNSPHIIQHSLLLFIA